MTNSSVDPVPVILDVDTGIDDAVAIALASAWDAADLVAVTTLAGNTTIDNATANSMAVLHVLGRDEIPVHRGASKPLARPLVSAAHVHHDNGIGGAKLAPALRPEGSDRGPAAIIRMARERPCELTLVCAGPLTNLSIALNVAPELPQLLRRVVVMGGAYRVAGNVTRTAEFNFYCDPEAADHVFSSQFPEIIAVGLDVSHDVALTRDVWQRASDVDRPEARLVYQLLTANFADPTVSGFYMHDALALAVGVDPTLVDCVSSQIHIHAGVDERGASRLESRADVQVATEVSSQRFLRVLLEEFGIPL